MILGKVTSAPLVPTERDALHASVVQAAAGSAAPIVRSGADWLAASEEHEPANTWSGDDGFCLIAGKPRVAENRELAAAAGALGMAAACAQEYSRTGPDFLRSLRDAFAVVIHVRGGKTLLAVDRLAIAPLYYSVSDAGISFASRLAALRAVPGVDATVDPQAVHDYLFFHMVPGPKTVFKGIRRLPLAGFVEWDTNGERGGRYWKMQFEPEARPFRFGAAKSEFVTLLKTSVRTQVESHENVGCFLSGGTDSSTLAGMVAAVTGQPARTYSIGFDQRGFDEIEYARIAARHFGTRHKEYYLQPSDIVRLVGRLGSIYGQPFGNSSVIPTYYCAEMARADGVETLIGGDGGDELFGGNSRYATQVLFSYYLQLPEFLRHRILEPLTRTSRVLKGIMPIRKLGRYIEQALVPMPDRLQTYNYLNVLQRRSIFEPEFLDRLDPDGADRSLREAYGEANTDDLLNKMMALDLRHTLADNDLPKVTQMCAAAGVDVVFPFLAEEMVDFAGRLPSRQKVNRQRLRYFFKKALADFLPREIIRKKKHGFGMPFGDWIVTDGPLRELTFDGMASLKTRGIVRPAFVEDLCETRLKQHPNYYGGFIWILLILELWIRESHAS